MAKRTQRRERRKLRAYKFFNRVLKATLGQFLRLRYNVRVENPALIKQLSPPYLILPNHMSFWDPFLLGTFVPEPIYYVVSDAHFRSPILNFLLGMVGGIPKTKVLNDYETVRSIMRVRRANGVVGIFPEGRRTWDGTTLPMYYSIAKLARMLKIPVVTVLFEGAFLSLPRWTRNRRRGTVLMKFKITTTAEESAQLSPDEIFTRISDDLDYDEYEYQRKSMIRYRGRRPAEKIEQVLYACPQCRSFGTLFSRDDLLRCVSCGYTVRYGELGFLKAVEPFATYHDTVRAWNIWQTEHLIGHLKRMSDPEVAAAFDHYHEPIFRRTHVMLFTGYRSEPLKAHPEGEIRLHSDGIVYLPARKSPFFIPFEELRGANVQNHERLEFYSGRVLYSFESSTRQWSTYSWVNAITILKAVRAGTADEIRTVEDVHTRHQEGQLLHPKRKMPEPTG